MSDRCTHPANQLRRLASGSWWCLACQSRLGAATVAWLGLDDRRAS